MLQFISSELIIEILSHILPEPYLSVVRPDLFPWYLGRICTSWRTVFISSPRFWSTLDVRTDPRPWEKKQRFQNCDHIFELVKLALERSNGYPLSLSVTMYDVFQEVSPRAMRARDILEMLVSHSLNWRDICMALHPSSHSTLYGAKGRLPFLRSLKFNAPSTTWNAGEIVSDSVIFQDIFFDAAQLTSIYLAKTTCWKINWPLVTVIHLYIISTLDEVIPILQQTSALEKLVIEHVFSDDKPDANTISPIYLLSLKKLYIPALLSLSLLHTPSLEELHVWNIPEIDTELLRATLSGYFATVRNLRLLAVYMSDMQLLLDMEYPLAIFQEAPRSTQSLRLEYRSFASKQLAGFSHLHNLKTISLITHSPEIPKLLETVENCEINLGFLKNLAQFSLDLFLDNNGPDVQEYLMCLSKVLGDRGIKFVVQIIPESRLHNIRVPVFGIPVFDIL